jgi:hypothetical protein
MRGGVHPGTPPSFSAAKPKKSSANTSAAARGAEIFHRRLPGIIRTVILVILDSFQGDWGSIATIP